MKKIEFKWLLCIFFFILFLVLSFLILKNNELKIDTLGYDLIYTNFSSDKMTSFVKIITNLGSSLCFCVLTAISIIFIKDRKIGISVLINLICVFLSNLLLKNIFCRSRPFENMIIYEKGYSFPSGHSMISMAFYGYLIYLVYKNIKNKKFKWASIIFLSIIILLIGISRIYLGVHYTSDILGGYLIGISYLILYIIFINKYFYKNI